jgi:hypothetical protein
LPKQFGGIADGVDLGGAQVVECEAGDSVRGLGSQPMAPAIAT